MTKDPKFWSGDPKNVKLLQDMWKDGKSGSQIGIAIGITRSAVLGFVDRHRKKLGLAERVISRKKAAVLNRVKTKRIRPPKMINPDQKRLQEIRLQILKDEMRPDNQHNPDPNYRSPNAKTIQQISSNTCKWPIGNPGEPDFHFCGAKQDKVSYCMDHYARAYKPNVIRARP